MTDNKKAAPDKRAALKAIRDKFTGTSR